MPSLRTTGGNNRFFSLLLRKRPVSFCDVVIIQNLTAVKLQSGFFYVAHDRLSQSIESKGITISAWLPSFKLLKKLYIVRTRSIDLPN
jgi:hypothetical protein